MGSSKTVDVGNVISKMSVPADVLERAKRDMSDIESSVLKFRAKNSLNISRKSASLVYLEELELILSKIATSTTLDELEILQFAINDEKSLFFELYRMYTIGNEISKTFESEEEKNRLINGDLNEIDNEKLDGIFNLKLDLSEKKATVKESDPAVVSFDSDSSKNTGKPEKLSYKPKKMKIAKEYLKKLEKAILNFKKSIYNNRKIVVKNHVDEKKSENLYKLIGTKCNKLVLEANYYASTKGAEKLADYADRANEYILKYTNSNVIEYKFENLKEFSIPTKYIVDDLTAAREWDISSESDIKYKYSVEKILEEYSGIYNDLSGRLKDIKNIRKRKSSNVSFDLNNKLEKLKKFKKTVTNLRADTKTLKENFPELFKVNVRLNRSLKKLSDKEYYSKLDKLLDDYINLKNEIKYGKDKKKDDAAHRVDKQIKEANSRLNTFIELISDFANSVIRSKNIEDISNRYKKLNDFDLEFICNSDASVENIITWLENFKVSAGNLSDDEDSKYLEKLNKLLLNLSPDIEEFMEKYKTFHAEYENLMFSLTRKGKVYGKIKKVAYVLAMLSSLLAGGLNTYIGMEEGQPILKLSTSSKTLFRKQL